MPYVWIASLILWAAAFGLSLWATALVLSHFRTHNRRAVSGPPISVLKPLKGCDAELAANLKSFFELNYPRFELIFCLESFDDPALEILETVRHQYSHVDVKILVGSSPEAINPKVSNLLKGYRAANFDTLLISDSNVRVPSDYLTTLISNGDETSFGLISAGVVADSDVTWGSRLEALNLNAHTLRWLLILNQTGQPIVVGKSMLFRRSTFERFGGLQALGRYLAEDYMAGFAIKRLGLNVIQAHEPLRQILGPLDISAFMKRQIRWARIRWKTSPQTYVFEPLSFCLPSGLFGAAAVYGLGWASWSAFLSLHLALWFAADLSMSIKFDRRVDLKFLATWLLREVLMIPIWIAPFLSSDVEWRGHRLKLEAGGTLTRPA